MPSIHAPRAFPCPPRRTHAYAYKHKLPRARAQTPCRTRGTIHTQSIIKFARPVSASKRAPPPSVSLLHRSASAVRTAPPLPPSAAALSGGLQHGIMPRKHTALSALYVGETPMGEKRRGETHERDPLEPHRYRSREPAPVCLCAARCPTPAPLARVPLPAPAPSLSTHKSHGFASFFNTF